MNSIANYRDLDVLAAGPVVRDLSGVFDQYWNSSSTVPIAAIVDRAHGAADLDGILVRLREAIAAADYPYPIDQDLDELGAQSAELRDNLVWAHGQIVADDPETVTRGQDSDDVIAFIRGRIAKLKEEVLVESPYFVLPAAAQAIVKALHERNVQVRVLTNSLASNDMLPAHSGYAKTRRRLLENGMELYELRPDTDAFRSGWSLLSGRSPAALHTKAMAFDGEAVFIGSFNLDPRSAWINTEAGLYIESPELAKKLTAYMATGVVPANSYYRVRLNPNGEIVWETERDGQRVRYQDEPETGFRRRSVADLLEAATDRLAAPTPILGDLGQAPAFCGLGNQLDVSVGSKSSRKCPCLRGMSVLPSAADIIIPPRHVRKGAHQATSSPLPKIIPLGRRLRRSFLSQVCNSLIRLLRYRRRRRQPVRLDCLGCRSTGTDWRCRSFD